MNDKICFDPTSDKWVLSDGEHYLEVPHWAREIIADEFERETEPLKAENAKLREECDMYRDLVGMMDHPDLNAQLQADNAKLRELVEDMLDCIDIQIAFERVPARWMREEFAGRARELRIEVDG